MSHFNKLNAFRSCLVVFRSARQTDRQRGATEGTTNISDWNTSFDDLGVSAKGKCETIAVKIHYTFNCLLFQVLNSIRGMESTKSYVHNSPHILQ